MMLYGKNPVLERLRVNPGSIKELYLQKRTDLSAIVKEAKKALDIPSKAPIAESTPKKVEANKSEAKNHVSHYDTLIRFAAVELEGSVKQKG